MEGGVVQTRVQVHPDEFTVTGITPSYRVGRVGGGAILHPTGTRISAAAKTREIGHHDGVEQLSVANTAGDHARDEPGITKWDSAWSD